MRTTALDALAALHRSYFVPPSRDATLSFLVDARLTSLPLPADVQRAAWQPQEGDGEPCSTLRDLQRRLRTVAVASYVFLNLSRSCAPVARTSRTRADTAIASRHPSGCSWSTLRPW